MKVLLTSFEPFNNNDYNISYEVMKEVNLKNHSIEKLLLPVDLTAFSILKKKVESYNPDVIILTGEARSRASISIETKAINKLWKQREIDGILSNEVVLNAPEAYFSKFQTVSSLSTLIEANFNVNLSNDCGDYMCNAIYYETLHNFDIESVFIHFPSYQSSSSLKEFVCALELMIDSLE